MPQQYAGPQQYSGSQQYAPPQQYGTSPQYTGGYYGPQPGGFPYPPVAQPARKRGLGNIVILLVALVVLVGIAVPVVNALTASPYMNEAYSPPDPSTNPPGLPTVKGETDARQVITANALYSQNIPLPTKCIVTAIDLSTAPETQLNDHMSAVIACLMRVWDTTVTNAGYSMPRPPLVIYSTPVSSACGKLTTMNAAYCGSDQKIYYATDLPKAIPNDLRSSRFVVEVIVAHEFGHAVQARTAILSAGHGLEDSASNDAARREWSRRIELQADCFAGMFIHSVAKSAGMTQQDLDNIAALMTSFGDDSLSQNATVDGSHGTGASRKYWAQLGLASTSLGVCNTFAAPSDEVR
jgi:predicted metalloprotease